MQMKITTKFKLFPKETFQPNNDCDLLPYYYRPLIGNLYCYRIQQGLSLLSPPYETVLEFGYGSGLLLPTLATISSKLYGIDIGTDSTAVTSCLKKINVSAILYENDLLEMDFKDNAFDLIVAFSIFEHINDCRKILQKMFHILKPNGRLLVGMPRVDKNMARLFSLIGFDTIEQHHVTSYKSFLNDCRGAFILEKQAKIFPFLPSSMGLYFNMLLKKA